MYLILGIVALFISSNICKVGGIKSNFHISAVKVMRIYVIVLNRMELYICCCLEFSSVVFSGSDLAHVKRFPDLFVKPFIDLLQTS
jgi:hypothetical protein